MAGTTPLYRWISKDEEEMDILNRPESVAVEERVNMFREALRNDPNAIYDAVDEEHGIIYVHDKRFKLVYVNGQFSLQSPYNEREKRRLFRSQWFTVEHGKQLPVDDEVFERDLELFVAGIQGDKHEQKVMFHAGRQVSVAYNKDVGFTMVKSGVCGTWFASGGTKQLVRGFQGSEDDEKEYPIRKIIFATSGVPYAVPNTIHHNVKSMRRALVAIEGRPSVKSDIQFVEIEWCRDLNLGPGIVETATIADVTLNMALYCNPVVGNQIRDVIRNQMNQKMAFLRDVDPGFFGRQGEVSIISHTLGAVACFDIVKALPTGLTFEVSRICMMGSGLRSFLEYLDRPFVIAQFEALQKRMKVLNVKEMDDPFGFFIDDIVGIDGPPRDIHNVIKTKVLNGRAQIHDDGDGAVEKHGGKAQPQLGVVSEGMLRMDVQLQTSGMPWHNREPWDGHCGYWSNQLFIKLVMMWICGEIE